MPQLVDLPDFVNANNHRGFLKAYLELIAQGYTLSIPTEVNLPELIEGWNQILPRITSDFTDRFVERLSIYWRYLIIKQGGKVTDNFASELLEIIDVPEEEPQKKEEASPLPKITNPNTTTTTVTPDITEIKREPTAGEVKSSISNSYYKTNHARHSELLGKEKLQRNIKNSIDINDADGFLIHYLSFSRYGKKPKVPMSTIMEMIKNQWEEILMTEQNIMPNDEFINKVSVKWFYIVNHRGIPYSKESLEELLYFLMSTYKKPSSKPSLPKKGGFLKKFFKK